jgi:hypothetical protein
MKKSRMLALRRKVYESQLSRSAVTPAEIRELSLDRRKPLAQITPLTQCFPPTLALC